VDEDYTNYLTMAEFNDYELMIPSRELLHQTYGALNPNPSEVYDQMLSILMMGRLSEAYDRLYIMN
jgi:hypothetical protein